MSDYLSEYDSKYLGSIQTREVYESRIKEQQAIIQKLCDVIDDAADDIVDYANRYNNDSTIVVTEAHEEAEKYCNLAQQCRAELKGKK